jgi:hypothetical protein
MLEFEKKKYILKEDFYIQSNVSLMGDGVDAVSERRFNALNEESTLSFEVSLYLVLLTALSMPIIGQMY